MEWSRVEWQDCKLAVFLLAEVLLPVVTEIGRNGVWVLIAVSPKHSLIKSGKGAKRLGGGSHPHIRWLEFCSHEGGWGDVPGSILAQMVNPPPPLSRSSMLCALSSSSMTWRGGGATRVIYKDTRKFLFVVSDFANVLFVCFGLRMIDKAKVCFCVCACVDFRGHKEPIICQSVCVCMYVNRKRFLGNC